MENEKPVILIADDAIENIDILYNLLKEDYEIIVASNGNEVVRLVNDKKVPDLILLDIMMPGMNGFDTISVLKKNQNTKSIPVIFLTSLNESEDLVKGFSLGAVDYVGKPFNASELLSRVKTQITIKKHEDLIKRQSFELKELLQIMCHDLASNFTVFKSSIWLAENKENGSLNEYMDRIKMATYNGIDIINLVREMRALEDKKLTLEKMNLLMLINKSLKLQKDNLEKKAIKTELDIPQKLQVIVEPRSFVNSVANNILSNSIKFSYEKSNIKISARESNEGIFLKFKDAGVGIPDHLLNKIFDFSQKTSRLGTRGEKGTGFGMPLVKKFVDLYDGQIKVNSTVNKNHGSEIILLLRKGQ